MDKCTVVYPKILKQNAIKLRRIDIELVICQQFINLLVSHTTSGEVIDFMEIVLCFCKPDFKEFSSMHIC